MFRIVVGRLLGHGSFSPRESAFASLFRVAGSRIFITTDGMFGGNKGSIVNGDFWFVQDRALQVRKYRIHPWDGNDKKIKLQIMRTRHNIEDTTCVLVLHMRNKSGKYVMSEYRDMNKSQGDAYEW